MQIHVSTPDEYVEQLADDRKEAIQKLRQVIKKNLSVGFAETINYGMIGYVVPHSLYAPGYHCDAKQPLPFINLASQKNFIALYHMGMYADKKLLDWFTAEYPKYCKWKIDLGKSCIRFKKMDDIPYDLIGRLAGKMSVEDWIAKYKEMLNR